MLSFFLALAATSGLWEIWILRAYLMGAPLWPTEGSAWWWVGFSANGSMMLWMLIDCLARPLKSKIRSRWIAAIVFLGVIGSATYFFLVKMKKQQQGFEAAS